VRWVLSHHPAPRRPSQCLFGAPTHIDLHVGVVGIGSVMVTIAGSVRATARLLVGQRSEGLATLSRASERSGAGANRPNHSERFAVF